MERAKEGRGQRTSKKKEGKRVKWEKKQVN